MTGGARNDEPGESSAWPGQPPTEQTAPFWTPRQQDQSAAWDEAGWWRDQPEMTGRQPEMTGRQPEMTGRQPEMTGRQPEMTGRQPEMTGRHEFAGSGPRRSRRKLAVASIVVAVVAVLVAGASLTGLIGGHKARVPGFHPTATAPAAAARQTAEVFLAAWQRGQIAKAAGYTDHRAAAAAALTSYEQDLHLQALHLAVDSATAHGTVAFSVHAVVGLAATKSVTGTWSYPSELHAYEKRGGWWVTWSPALVAPKLATGETVASFPVAPGSAKVVDAAGADLADSSDPGLDNIAAALRSNAPVGLGTPGVEVELVSRHHAPIASTADLLRRPVDTAVVKTTIDPAVEAAAEAAVQAHPDSSMVVLQPSTGHILAVANNDGQNDFALTARVAPGSTNKIITSTALLSTGLVSSPSQPVGCPPRLIINGEKFKNDKGESEPDSTPFLTDFAASCNNAFARWYARIGSGTLAQTARKYYGLNQPWNIGIGPGGPYYAIPAAAYNGELAQELFGQGQLEASPLAMASVGATVDTGHFKQPIVVPAQPRLTATPLPAGVHQDLWQMMRAVTQSGGTAAGVFDGVSSAVYGKTGTADVGGQQQPNSWMVAFDPTLNVAIGCLVLNAGYGASFAGPEAAAVLQHLSQ